MIWFLLACTSVDPGETDATVDEAHTWPHLWATPDDKEIIQSRRDTEPWSIAWDYVLGVTTRELRIPDAASGDGWDDSAHRSNAELAAAHALIAWVDDDAAAAAAAVEALALITDDLYNSAKWDLNIRMPHILMPMSDAHDFLSATDFVDQDTLDDIEAKTTTINGHFYNRYVLDDFYRSVALGPSQNNHPIRTASAIGYVALAFPEHPDADEWLNWSASELDYLWGKNGQYVQPDGGVSEGPFYYGFALTPTVAFYAVADQVLSEGSTLQRDCINRQDVDPWAGHGCVDGEDWAFVNHLRSGQIASTVDWSISIRLPWGHRPPLADGYLEHTPRGSALLTHFTGEPRYQWDWEVNRRAYSMGDMAPMHLLYIDEGTELAPPDWGNQFLPDAGNAIFRSGWDDDARWMVLVAEEGAARKTLHDHVDGTSFQMAAYGEYLLADSGYYKPFQLDNAVTSQAPSHNLILIDGATVPKKGRLTNFGDGDAYLESTGEDGDVAYADARQTYQDTEVVRSMVFVDDRYFVIGDQLTGGNGTAREHRWRLHGYAGFDSGGSYSLNDQGANFQRELAGVDAWVASVEDGLVFEEPAFNEDEAPHVHVFLNDSKGPSAHHGVMDGVIHAVAPDFLTVLAPYRVGDTGTDGPMEVTSVNAGDAAVAWRIAYGDVVDVAWLRNDGASETLVVDGHSVSSTVGLAIERIAGDGTVAFRR
jgi:hypothetical protein